MDFTKMTKVDKSLSFEDRIGFLRYCADLYESGGISPLQDSNYDIEYSELEEINPDHDFFNSVGGIDTDHIYGTPVKHEVIMGSLNKSPDTESFIQWAKSTFGAIPSFVFQHKIDGLSLGLLYENGKLIRAVTRGDGITGVDVTPNALNVSGVKSTISCKEKIEIRGECFKDKFDFYKNWHLSVMENGYKNPRNFAAGSLNQSDPKVTKERGLEFIAYECIHKKFKTETEKMFFIKGLGFNDLSSSTRKTKCGLTCDHLLKAIKAYMDSIDRPALPYSIDGAVVKVDDVSIYNKMGFVSNGKKPRSNRAVKFPLKQVETVVEGVVSETGRTGVIVPVAKLRPIDLDGAMISRATLHNYGSLVADNALRIGAKVIIARKGEIIPQIISIKENKGTKIEVPTHCPSCNEKVEWDTNKVNIVCNNPLCSGQLTKRIEHYFVKIGVKGFGPSTINKLVDDLKWDDEPIVTCIADMYVKLNNDRKTDHPFRKYNYLKEQLGEKTYDNLISSIFSVKRVNLDTFIQALGIARVGTMSREIVAIAPTMDDIDKLTVNDIMAIDKFGPIKAQNFVDGWKKIREEIDEISKHIEIETPKKASNKLDGKKFCFTGSFGIPRSDLQKMADDNGGKSVSSVGNGTILVWDGSTTKGKYEKAIKGKNEIISEDDFLGMIK